MLPIPDKAWVTGEFMQDWKGLRNGDACIILSLNDGIVFKIVENKLNEEHKLTLFSLNPIYKPFDIPAGEVKEVWRFVHYISSEIPDPVMPGDELVKTVSRLKYEVETIKNELKMIRE
jgi:hypothetical protein